jgi:hypothetical protein
VDSELDTFILVIREGLAGRPGAAILVGRVARE